MTDTQRNLGGPALASLLVSAHYGLGFLLGTGEGALAGGLAGSLYAVSIAVGTLILLGLARFYWQKIEQLWTILGDRYGQSVRALVAVIAWASLIGAEAVQIISGVSILSIFGWPTLPTALGLMAAFAGLSLLPIARLSWLLRALLVFNVAVLLFALVALQGTDIYVRAPLQVWPALVRVAPGEAIGVSITTIALVLVDMKYQQYLVRARDLRSLYWGCTLAACLLFALALLPAALTIAAGRAEILPAGIDGKAVVPYILAWLGGGPDRALGVVLVASLIVPALGVGSGVLRLQTKAISDFKLLPDTAVTRGIFATGNGLLGLAVALKGGSLIGTMVCFYAAYAAVVWVPFGAYLWRGDRTSATSVRNALLCGGVGAIGVLVMLLFFPQWAPFERAEIGVAVAGSGLGLLGLLGTQAWESYILPRRGLSSN
ncbi:MAG: hypothetical protein AAFY11_05150 [Cyanobacteria bacterium J06641_5]